MGFLKNLFTKQKIAGTDINPISPDVVQFAYAELQARLEQCQLEFVSRVEAAQLAKIALHLQEQQLQAEQDSTALHQLIVDMKQEVERLKRTIVEDPQATHNNGMKLETYIIYKELLISDLVHSLEQFDEACGIATRD